MGGAASRSKGARGELAICKMLTENLGGEFSRNLKQYQKSQEGDIAQLVGPYLLEVKNSPDGVSNIKAWWKQAVTAADKVGALPCLAYNTGAGRWRFVIPMQAAWGSGHQWARDLQYTQTLHPDGFFFVVRELIGG